MRQLSPQLGMSRQTISVEARILAWWIDYARFDSVRG